MPAHKAVSVIRLLLNKFPRESRVARQPLADDAGKFGIGEVGDRIWFVERLRRSGRRGVDMHFDGGSFEIHLPERGGMADCAPFARKGDRRPVHEPQLVSDEEQALKCYLVANAGAAVEKPHVPPFKTFASSSYGLFRIGHGGKSATKKAERASTGADARTATSIATVGVKNRRLLPHRAKCV